MGAFRRGAGPPLTGRSAGLTGGSPDASAAAVEDYLLPSRLELPTFAPPAQLVPTIYPSEKGVTERGASGRKSQGQGPHMLSTAVRIHLDPHKNVKVWRCPLLPAHSAGATACPVRGGLGSPSLTVSRPQEFLVTLRLHRATLRHYVTLPEQSWHSQVGGGAWVAGLGAGGGWCQGWGRGLEGGTGHRVLTTSPTWSPKLLEFLDVLDDPVLGYLPPTVITILHTHLFSCAVDYRYPVWVPGAGGRLSRGCEEPAPASLSPPDPSTSLCVSSSPPRPSPSPVISSWTPPPSCSGRQPPAPVLSACAVSSGRSRSPSVHPSDDAPWELGPPS